jgi:hypothetical protein
MGMEYPSESFEHLQTTSLGTYLSVSQHVGKITAGALYAYLCSRGQVESEPIHDTAMDIVRKRGPVCFRQNQARYTDFRNDKRTGKYDRVVTWSRGRRPA